MFLVRSSVFSTFDATHEEFATVLFKASVFFEEFKACFVLALLQDELRLSFLPNPVIEIFFDACAEGIDNLDPFRAACDFEDTTDFYADLFLPL